MVKILNWSHNTWDAFFHTAVLHSGPNVRGLLFQFYMVWTGNSNLCTCGVLFKKPNKTIYIVFPPWALPALQNFHLRKFKANLAHRCQLLCKGLGGDRPAEKKKNEVKTLQGAFLLGRCRIPERDYLWAFYTAKKIYPFFSMKFPCCKKVPWNKN